MPKRVRAGRLPEAAHESRRLKLAPALTRPRWKWRTSKSAIERRLLQAWTHNSDLVLFILVRV